MTSWSPKTEARNLPADFCEWAAMSPLLSLLRRLRIIVIQPGLVHGQQARQEITWIAPKKFQTLLRRLATLTYTIRVQAFWDPICGELPHVQIFMNDGPNPLKWDAQLLSYWFGRNPAVFQDKLVNLINNIRGGYSFGSSITRRNTGGKITTLKLGHPVLSLVLNGSCSPNVSVGKAWISSGALPCKGKKLNGSSNLHVVEMVRVAWHASFQPL